MNIILLISIFLCGFFVAVFIDLIVSDIFYISINEFFKEAFWLIKNKINIFTFLNSDTSKLNDDQFSRWLNIVPKHQKKFWEEKRNKYKKVNSNI